jgi:hypothetical protein
MKYLDYYYLVLLRINDFLYGKDKLFYYVPGIIQMTFLANTFSLLLFIIPHIVVQSVFWIIFIIIGIVLYFILDAIYNKKRRDRLREEYEDESDAHWRRGVNMVILYEVFSFAFLAFAIWIFWKSNNKPPPF